MSRDVRYSPSRSGMRQFVNSDMVGKAMLPTAEALSSAANAVGRSTYEARQATVQGGRSNTDRAGAEVVETDRHFADVVSHRLEKVTRDFRSRGGVQ